MKTIKSLAVRAPIISAFCLSIAWVIHPAAAAALEYQFTKKVDVGALQAQLVAAGFAVDFTECSAENCTVHLKPGETKNPKSIVDKYVYIDRKAVRSQNLDKIKILAGKLDSGSISVSEKDELLRLLIKHIVGF